MAGLFLLMGLVALLVSACSSAPVAAPQEATVVTPDHLTPSQVITIGDIDPDSPGKKIERFMPLANYLAENLEGSGIESGTVVIAQDMEQMAGYLRDGIVDIYFDSAFPTLNVQSMAGSEVVLRRWKNSEPSYRSVLVALRVSDVASPSDLIGKVIAFEEPHSTSGFVLPAGTLVEEGFALTEVGHPKDEVPPDKVGYFFSWSDNNTIQLLLRGEVAAGVTSNLDYEVLPAEVKDRTVVLEQTASVPRQLVSVRPGLDPEKTAKINELLMGLDQFDEGRLILKALRDTEKFDLIPPESEHQLSNLSRLMDLLLAN